MLIYECSICKGCFNSKSEWFHHLIQEQHLTLARREMLSWNEAVRARVIVVFAKLPVGQDVKVIDKLSTEGETVVTDFVWWKEERPRVGFVQFESRETSTKVLASLEDERFQIDDQVCQVMDGGTIAEPEWRTLFPASESENPQSTEQPTRVNVPIQALPSLAINSFTSTEGLRHCLSSILKSIQISGQEYNTALDITQTLQDALLHYPGPPITAFLCRHWILNLQYCPNNNQKNVGCSIAAYCSSSNDPNSPPTLPLLLKEHMMQYFNKWTKRNCHPFSRYLVKEVHPDRKSGMGKHFDRSKSRRYCFGTPQGHEFFVTIFFETEFPVECQVWKLAKYLCTFDPRCYPLLGVLFHWAKVNSVYFGKKQQKGFVKNLGDPCGLTWLLIFFLQREGLVPSTKEVLERPHEHVYYEEIDVGFADSSEFATDWKRSKNTEEMDDSSDEFSMEVFSLLYKFFWFCHAQLGQATKGRGLMLNTRDAEIISVVDLVAGSVKDSKLSAAELDEIKNCLRLGQSLEMEVTVMLNPLITNWKISTANAGKAYLAMKKTALKMKNYFEKNDGRAAVTGSGGKLEEFLDLLKL